VATRVSPAPILGRSEEDPFSGGAVFVHFEKERNLFHMWYESCLGWTGNGDSPEATFALKYAVSQNGRNWQKIGSSCIPFSGKNEYLSNPSVIQEDGLFKMWYSFKTDGKYRIGYAESEDAVNWERKDGEAGITVSTTGWDSDEIEYPHVFDHQCERYMLYCGNRYGKTGFGIAVLDRA